MKKLGILLMLCAGAVSAAAQGAGKVSYSDISFAPAAAQANEGHKETIEIQSWSLTRNGNLQITQYVVPASVGRLCQSRATLPSLTLESAGQRHVFRNVVFDQCPAGGSTGGTFTLTFNGQTTTPLGASTWDRPNTTISGLTPAMINVRLLSMKVRGNKASVIFAAPRTLILPPPAPASAPAISEIVVTKMDGTSWSYSGAHAHYQDVTIPASAQGSARVVEMTIDFASMKGARGDYVDPESPLARQ